MNNKSTLTDQSTKNYKIAINSIQRTANVDRLYVNVKSNYGKIIPYDLDNLYPNKIKNIAKRSGTTTSAMKKFSEFISGSGFEGMDTVLNSDGQTGWDILRFITDSFANFQGFALHFNYNIFGGIIEINPINFEFVRWAKELDHFIVSPDWPRKSMNKDETLYFPYNPDKVSEEINEAGGIDKYNGQLFYWIPNLADYYTACYWDSVLDDAQFEAEAKLYSLSGVQNDYSLAGMITLPVTMKDDKEVQEFIKEIEGDIGSGNAGGIRVFHGLPIDQMQNWKYFTPISRNNVDSLHSNQLERAKMNIYAAYNQPPILSGIATQGMFNEESFADAFNYYNAAVETERKIIERELQKIFATSIWPNLENIEIIPKDYVTRAKDTNQKEPVIDDDQTTE